MTSSGAAPGRPTSPFRSPRVALGGVVAMAKVRRLALWLVAAAFAVLVLRRWRGCGLGAGVAGCAARADPAADDADFGGARIADAALRRQVTVLTAADTRRSASGVPPEAEWERNEWAADGRLRRVPGGQSARSDDGGRGRDEDGTPVEFFSGGGRTRRPGGRAAGTCTGTACDRQVATAEGSTDDVSAETEYKASAVRGELGRAAFREIPFTLPNVSRFVPPPPHWSYVNVLRSLSAEDWGLLEALRLNYTKRSALEDAECGTWQKEYAALHRAMMDGDQPARTATYLCRRGINCGGLADRLLGMATVMIFSLLDRRAFLAHWELPLSLEALFEPAEADWSLGRAARPGELQREWAYAEGRGQEFTLIHAPPFIVDKRFVGPPGGWAASFPEDHVTFLTNRGTPIRLFGSPEHAPRLRAMGLKPETAFGCVLDYFLRPNPAILDAASRLAALFRLPSVFSVGIQIRTGDSAIMDPRGDRASARGYAHFFECAEQLARTRAPPGRTVVFFLLTDSTRLRDQAAQMYRASTTRKLLVSGMPIAHIDRTTDFNGAAASVVENWVLAATDFRVISRGGYGKIAAFRSRSPNSTIVLPSSPRRHDSRHPLPKNCGDPAAFTRFEDMAQEWSLG